MLGATKMLMDNVQALNNQQIFGAKRVNFSNTLPTGLLDKDLWFEPSYAPQPWEYDANGNVWRSQPVTTSAAINYNFGTATAFKVSIPFFPSAGTGTDYIWLESVSAILSVRSGTSAPATDFLTATLAWATKTQAASATAPTTTNLTYSDGTTTITGNTNGLAVGAYRRFWGNIYQYLTNPAYITLIVTRNGTATNLVGEAAFTIAFKNVRLNA